MRLMMITKMKLFDIKLQIINENIDMSYMFSNCNLLIKFPNISEFKDLNVIKMTGIFLRCRFLKFIPDISNLNTSNIENMSFLFSECNSLKSLPDISK